MNICVELVYGEREKREWKLQQFTMCEEVENSMK
jgi:hypothetical protein